MGIQVVVDLAARSDVGRKRRSNEDAFVVGDLLGRALAVRERRPLGQGLLLAVCDGMGGHDTGDTAAREAGSVLTASMGAPPLPRGEDELAERLERAVGAANEALLEAARTDRARIGTCATMTAFAVIAGAAALTHVGDTRAYLLRARRLAQITRDDRLLDELRAQGREVPPEYEVHRHVITQALGLNEGLVSRGARLALRRGDVLLLCTDGLTDMIADDAIRAVLLRHRDPGVAAQVLVDEACDAGGDDNVTVLVARFEGDGLLAPAEGETP